MRVTLAWAGILVVLCACGPSTDTKDPRARQGSGGALAWRHLSQIDGQAAFLARPGRAPDLVLWCRDRQSLTLRAHGFKNVSARPDLQLTSAAGVVLFEDVRAQGGVRVNDRKLVEGRLALSPTHRAIVGKASAGLTLQSGTEIYRAHTPDSATALEQFLSACERL
jgi:hypothetical protein